MALAHFSSDTSSHRAQDLPRALCRFSPRGPRPVPIQSWMSKPDMLRLSAERDRDPDERASNRDHRETRHYRSKPGEAAEREPA
jgi:hypothetical protein